MVAPISSHVDCWRAVLSRGFIFFCSAVSAIGGLSIAMIRVVRSMSWVSVPPNMGCANIYVDG